MIEPGRLVLEVDGIMWSRVVQPGVGAVVMIEGRGTHQVFAMIPLEAFERGAVRFLELLGRVKFEGEPRAKL